MNGTDDMRDYDLMVADSPDASARFPTCIATLQDLMEACAESHVHCRMTCAIPCNQLSRQAIMLLRQWCQY